MEITIDLQTCKIIVSFKRPQSPYAVLISKISGDSISMTVPELVDALRKAKEGKK